MNARLPGFEDAILNQMAAMPADRQVFLLTVWLKERNSGNNSDGKGGSAYRICPKIAASEPSKGNCPVSSSKRITPRL